METQTKLGKVVEEFEVRDDHIERVRILELLVPRLVDDFHDGFFALHVGRVNKTWYKELQDPDMFYMIVTDLTLLDNLTEFCSGLHAVDVVDILQLMKTLYADAKRIPQFINAR